MKRFTGRRVAACKTFTTGCLIVIFCFKIDRITLARVLVGSKAIRLCIPKSVEGFCHDVPFATRLRENVSCGVYSKSKFGANYSSTSVFISEIANDFWCRDIFWACLFSLMHSFPNHWPWNKCRAYMGVFRLMLQEMSPGGHVYCHKRIIGTLIIGTIWKKNISIPFSYALYTFWFS